MTRESLIKGHGGIARAIDRWLAAGLIDAATAERLHAAEMARKPVHTGRLAILAFGFGGLLLAAGVFLFVAANWQEMSPWSRFATLITLVAVLHVGAAFGSRFSGALATSLHAVGTAALGAGIFLSGQIFNLQEHWPQAFLLWALGAAVAAWLLRDWPQVSWVAILGPAWLAAEWASKLPWYQLAMSGRAVESVIPFGIVVLGTAYLSATARGLDASWRNALAYLGAGALIIAASGLASSGAGMFPTEMTPEPVPATLLAVGWSVAIALPLVVAALLRGKQAWPVAIAAALAGVVVALDPAVTWQRLCIYLVYAAGSVALVGWGQLDRQRLRVNLGVLGFALTVLAFYFSSLFDMLGRALGLICMGLLCILGGWLAERIRRKLIARLAAEEAP